MGTEIVSPRCEKACTLYPHPDAEFLPLPDSAPPPRLFVVYGDGEAEELLPARVVRDALNLAAADENAQVVDPEPMGHPMEGCVCHTIFRQVPLDPISVPPEQQAPHIPPALSGFAEDDGFDFGMTSSRVFTEFRQFVEHPELSMERREAFRNSLARFLAHEESHRNEHAAYGEGLRLASKRLASKISLAPSQV